MTGKLQAFRYWVITVLILIIFFGVGHGVSMMPAQQTHHGQQSADMANHCQSACPPLLKEEKTPPLREDDDEPEPLPFTVANLFAYSNGLYAVALTVILFAYLRQRPPDLLAEYGLRRI